MNKQTEEAIGKLMTLSEVPLFKREVFIKLYPKGHPYMDRFNVTAEQVYDHCTKKKKAE